MAYQATTDNLPFYYKKRALDKNVSLIHALKLALDLLCGAFPRRGCDGECGSL
jgi:hypothetical protein